MNDSIPTSGWHALLHVLATVFVVIVLLAAIPISYRLLHDSANMPLCNKLLFVQMQNWFDLHKQLSDLPNVEGRSAESLRQLQMGDETEEWTKKYQYIAGLRRGDPGDLVFAYFRTPTRWKHHAAGAPSIFNEHKWIIVPLDFTGINVAFSTRVDRELPDIGEDAERVSLEEFKSRLKKTLDFLQQHNRPHWQTVVAENEEFLKSLDAKSGEQN